MIKHPYINISPLFVPFVLLAIMLIGLIVRADQYNMWSYLNHGYIQDGIPLIANVDGYYYLHLARDILENNYTEHDELRVYPEKTFRPESPPLLSWMSAKLAPTLGISLEAIAAFMPAFLGILLVIPIYFIGYYIKDRLTGFTAALFAIISPYFIYRSGLGWFDTDSLNVVFPFTFIALSMAIISSTKIQKSIVLLLSYCIINILFVLWWDQATYVVITLAAFPLLYLFILHYKERPLVFFVFASICITTFVSVIYNPNVIESLVNSFIYISKETSSQFPNHGVAITEQKALLLDKMIKLSSSSIMIFIISAVGFIYILVTQTKLTLLLIPLLIIGSFSYLYAERFLIFLIPIIALGLGGFISVLSSIRKGYLYDTLGLTIFLLISTSLLVSEDELYAKPIVRSDLVSKIQSIQELTPKNSVIWNWCDYGYPLIYWSRRATICDGSSHDGERSMYSAIPLAANSPRFSANFIYFYITHGADGVRKITKMFNGDINQSRLFLYKTLSSGPIKSLEVIRNEYSSIQLENIRELITFLFPSNNTPVYLYLDRHTMDVTSWWYWFSSWDPETSKGIKPYYRIFDQIEVDFTNRVMTSTALSVNLASGKLNYNQSDGQTMLSTINLIGKNNTETINFQIADSAMLDVSIQDNFATLLNPVAKNTVAHKLFTYKSGLQYFEPIKISRDKFQLWKVRSDSSLR